MMHGMGGGALACWRLLPQTNSRWLALIFCASTVYAPGAISARQVESENSRQQRQRGPQSTNGQEPNEESNDQRGRDRYADLARATGGFSYNGPSEYLDEATEILVSVTILANHNLAWVTGSVASPPAIEIPVAVDSTVEQMDFVVSTYANESAVMEVRRPDGSLVIKDQGAEFIIIPTAQRVRIHSPTAGEWRLSISGRARFDAFVVAKGGINLQHVAFLPADPDAKTFGPERIGGALPVRRQLRLEVALQGASDPVATLTLLDGTPLETVPLKPRAGRDGVDRPTHYTGEVFFAEASTGFVVIVSGKDPAGTPFSRLLRRVFKASEPPEQEETKPTRKHTERHLQRFHALLKQEANDKTPAVSAYEYLRDLPPITRLALARILANDPDARIGYAGSQILIAQGHIDEATPALAAMIVSGRAQTQLSGRMGYDWVHSDDDTLATRMMLTISKRLLARLDDYDADERRNAQVFLVGPRSLFTAEAAQRRIDKMEETLQEIIRRTAQPTSGKSPRN